ncbi:tyrosine-type recombinase/integrase [Thalassospira alkalitolerans]|uniref:tyrosine-type recombinase/integrase n=1 Tax=Thalassospira alkalitolerans TaxID=1293890 RepID=UPI003AA966C9
MHIDEYITIIHPEADQPLSIPQFLRMRDFEFMDIATEFLIQKSEGRLYDIFKFANDYKGMDYNLTPYMTTKGAAKRTCLAMSTIKLLAHHISFFFQWCEMKSEDDNHRKYDLRSILGHRWCGSSYASVEDYSDDLRELIYGSGRDRNVYTQRVNIVNELLMYAFSVGWRDDEYRPIVPVRMRGNIQAIDTAETSRKRKNKSDWIIPSPLEVKNWIAGIKSDENQLMAELACYGGFRKGDILGLRVSSMKLQNYEDTERNDRSYFRVFYSKGGKDRKTTLPNSTIKKLNKYIKTSRQHRLNAWAVDSDYVFLSPSAKAKGRPFTRIKVDEIFRNSPFGENWTPHQGRHVFAVHRLAQLIHRNMQAFNSDLENALLTAINHQGPLPTLQSEMGHASSETTEAYLRWGQRKIVEFTKIVADMK